MEAMEVKLMWMWFTLTLRAGGPHYSHTNIN